MPIQRDLERSELSHGGVDRRARRRTSAEQSDPRCSEVLYGQEARSAIGDRSPCDTVSNITRCPNCGQFIAVTTDWLHVRVSTINCRCVFCRRHVSGRNLI